MVFNASAIPALNISLPAIMLAMFLIAVLLFTLVTAVLVYHWLKYRVGTKAPKVASAIYLYVSVFALIAMLFSIIKIVYP